MLFININKCHVMRAISIITKKAARMVYPDQTGSLITLTIAYRNSIFSIMEHAIHNKLNHDLIHHSLLFSVQYAESALDEGKQLVFAGIYRHGSNPFRPFF